MANITKAIVVYKFKTECIKYKEGVYEPFVYIIEELETERLYIGSRTARGCKVTDLGVKYFTSSLSIKDSWRYNKAKFRVVQTHVCGSNHHALTLESVLLRICNAVYSESYLNRGHPSIGFNMSGFNLSEETKSKMSSVHKGKVMSESARLNNSKAKRGDRHPQFGKKGVDSLHWGRKRSQSTKELMSSVKFGLNNPFHGKTHSEESRKEMSMSQREVKKITCEFCEKNVKPGAYSRWHGDKCEWRGCTEDEIELINKFSSKQLAGRKYWYNKWCANNEEAVNEFTFFDYLRASLAGMVRINLTVKEAPNGD